MANRYSEAKKMYKNGDFIFNNLNGRNTVGSPQSKITIKGNLDKFTIDTLYSNYEQIADNLKVYPTITIHPRGYELEGDMGGFYYPQYNHIEMIDHWFLITILSHEMRHAFQFIYFPDLYYATEYTTAREYLNCKIERDARGYSLDYCTAKGYSYSEEAASIRDKEEKIELVIQNRLSLSVLELNETYFNINPAKAYSVPRNYHYLQSYNQSYAQTEVAYKHTNGLVKKIIKCFQVVIGCAVMIFIALILLGFFLTLL